MTSSNCKSKADHETRKAMVRARKFLSDRGIDSAAIIRREDAAAFMVGFALFEEAFSEERRAGRKEWEENRDAQRKLANS